MIITVNDLINELKQCPQEAEVTIEYMNIQRVVILPDGVVLEREGT